MAAAILTFGTCSGLIGDRQARRIEEPLFRPASEDEKHRLADLFVRTWQEAPGTVDPAEFHDIGYQAAAQDAAAGAYLAFREAAERLDGRGIYFLRTASHLPILLEAPHSNDDLLTGDIVARLFRNFPFAGAGFNSLSRWSVDDRARSGDLARRPDTVFTAFAEAFLAAHAGGTVIQIHGFDSEKRDERSFANVSEGTTRPSGRLYGHRACLDRLLPGRVMLFPKDTNELGGTLNATGRVVRERGGYFLHVELSLGLRRRLTSDPDLAARFAGCLLMGQGS
jgi:hypothetical protein